jgi:hypothetical protein
MQLYGHPCNASPRAAPCFFQWPVSLPSAKDAFTAACSITVSLPGFFPRFDSGIPHTGFTCTSITDFLQQAGLQAGFVSRPPLLVSPLSRKNQAQSVSYSIHAQSRTCVAGIDHAGSRALTGHSDRNREHTPKDVFPGMYLAQVCNLAEAHPQCYTHAAPWRVRPHPSLLSDHGPKMAGCCMCHSFFQEEDE